MISRHLIVLIIPALLLSCSRSYEPIPPKQVTAGQINFQGSDEKDVFTTFLYSVPNNYTSKKAFPLLVALHGGGSNDQAFHDLWKSTTDSLGFVLLTPRGEDTSEAGFGRNWGDNAERSVMICMDIVRKAVHVDPKRIYIAGFSSGGKLAYFLGLKYANLFHGFAALGAPLDVKWLAENKIIFNKQKVYIAHGSFEKEIAEKSMLIVDALRDRGVKLKYVQYEGIGHTLPEPKKRELGRILNYLDGQ